MAQRNTSNGPMFIRYADKHLARRIGKLTYIYPDAAGNAIEVKVILGYAEANAVGAQMPESFYKDGTLYTFAGQQLGNGWIYTVEGSPNLNIFTEEEAKACAEIPSPAAES